MHVARAEADSASDSVVLDWADERDRQTRRWLAGRPEFLHFRDLLQDELSAEERTSLAFGGGRRFELRRLPGEEHPSLWVDYLGDERVLVHGGELFESTNATIVTLAPSPSGDVVAWLATKNGVDWLTLGFTDVTTGEPVGNQLTGLKSWDLAWLSDESIAYMTFAKPSGSAALTALNSGPAIRIHDLRDETDRAVFMPESLSWMRPYSAGDGRLFIEVTTGIVPTRVIVNDSPDDPESEWRVLIEGDAPVRILGSVGDDLVILSHGSHPGGEIATVGVGDRSKRVLFSGSSGLIDRRMGCVVGSTVVFVEHLEDRMRCRTVPAKQTDAVVGAARSLIDENATIVRHLAVDRAHGRVCALLEAVGGPCSIAQIDPVTGESEEIWSDGQADHHPMTIETVNVIGSEGHRIPVRLVHSAETDVNSAPVLLEAYGGYAVPLLTSGYQRWHSAWALAGGVVAYAGVRGGGEKGEQWHIAATKTAKQRTFDDLADCAAYFGSETQKRSRVVVHGHSNGGLLAAVLLTQRPETIAGAVPEVAVLDMLHFHEFTSGHGWTEEYGDPADPAHASVLAAYSPIHNLVEMEYPPTLIIAADHDDRVPPLPHSYRFARLLAGIESNSGPVLLRIARNAGHGPARSSSETIDERAAILAFAASVTDSNSATRSE